MTQKTIRTWKDLTGKRLKITILTGLGNFNISMWSGNKDLMNIISEEHNVFTGKLEKVSFKTRKLLEIRSEDPKYRDGVLYYDPANTRKIRLLMLELIDTKFGETKAPGVLTWIKPSSVYVSEIDGVRLKDIFGKDSRNWPKFLLLPYLKSKLSRLAKHNLKKDENPMHLELYSEQLRKNEVVKKLLEKINENQNNIGEILRGLHFKNIKSMKGKKKVPLGAGMTFTNFNWGTPIVEPYDTPIVEPFIAPREEPDTGTTTTYYRGTFVNAFNEAYTYNTDQFGTITVGNDATNEGGRND